MNNDKLMIGGHSFDSRFILGSGKYSLKLIEAAVRDAGAQIITLAVRRANTTDHENILDYIPEGVTLLPNTSGARNAQEAVRIARLARELGCGDFVKIEIMRDTKYLLPDNQETIKATEILAKEGFVVMPYMYPDLNAARDMAAAGAAAIMPLGAPIGSRPSCHRRRRHRQAFPGLRSHGDGGCRHHGQYGPCHRRRPAPDGRSLPPGHRSRPQGISFRSGPGTDQRRFIIRPSDRVFERLREVCKWKISFS